MKDVNEDVSLAYANKTLDIAFQIIDEPKTDFVEVLKDETLRFRGSSNQRVIDVKKTRETGSIVLWD